MNWLYVVIAIAVIGGIIGYFTANDGERGEGFFKGCFFGGTGCLSAMIPILIGLLSLYLLISLGLWLFD